MDGEGFQVQWFRLSGNDHNGDEAERMYAIAQAHGFDRFSVGIQPWPIRGSARFEVWADVSGVSAQAYLLFDSRDAMLSWLQANPPRQPEEAAASECYRALAAVRAPAKGDA